MSSSTEVVSKREHPVARTTTRTVLSTANRALRRISLPSFAELTQPLDKVLLPNHLSDTAVTFVLIGGRR